MATYYQTDADDTFSYQQFAHLTHQHIHTTKETVKEHLKGLAFFHVSFMATLFLELLFFGCMALQNPLSWICATSLATTTLTGFTYLLLTHFMNSRLQEQLALLQKQFIQSCQREIPVETSLQERHLALAHCLSQLATFLEHKDIYTLHVHPFTFETTGIIYAVKMLACQHILTWQKGLMRQAITEHIAYTQIDPLCIASHISLARTYIALANVCQGPQDRFFSHPSITARYNKPHHQKTAQKATELAVEELQILNDLAPEDPWVHAQLARCYHHLENPPLEIAAYETLHHLRPEDKTVLFQLGQLYFAENQTAKGLKVYQKLLSIDAKTATQLLKHYTKPTTDL